jgi:hypothetical protein
VIVLVTGSRRWTSKAIIARDLELAQPSLIIQGGAKGADRLTKEIAREMRVYCAEVEAYWELGDASGSRRNEAMFKLNVDMVLAYPLPDSRGTVHAIAIARGLNLPTRITHENCNFRTFNWTFDW